MYRFNPFILSIIDDTQAGAERAADTPVGAPAGGGGGGSGASTGAPVGGATVTMPSRAMTKLKADERNRGANALARDLGYADAAAMKAAMAARGKPGAAPAKAGAAAPADAAEARPASTGPSKRERELEAKIADLAKRLARSEKLARSLKQQLDSQSAEHELVLAAVNAGVKDTDVALELLRKSLRNKSQEELAKFDPAAWFTSLRTSRPYLFGDESTKKPVVEEAEEAADTSALSEEKKPEVPDTGAGAGAGGSASVDGRKLDRAAYDKRLAELGLSSPSTQSVM